MAGKYMTDEVWNKESLQSISTYSLNRALVNINKSWRSDWPDTYIEYWATYYNKVEEELINRGYYE